MRPAQRAACAALAAVALTAPAAPASASAPHMTPPSLRLPARVARDHRLAEAAPAVTPGRGSRRWVARDPGIGHALAVSPDGSRAFVAGAGAGSQAGDYLTVAYDAATGARLWTAVFGSPGVSGGAGSIAVSPDGTKVFVTGSTDSATTSGYATVCYDAATGTQLWAATFHSPGAASQASSIAVSPGGSKVFVTGSARASATTSSYATVAYNAATGTRLWAAGYSGPASDSQAVAVAVSPGGSKVFVTGASLGRTGQYAYATVAYRAATGTRLWAARYTDGNRGAAATGLAVSRRGQVYVTGTDRTLHGIQAYATVAYDPDTGHQLWLARYNGLGETNYDTAVTVSSSQVFVTGQSKNPATGSYDYATVAYSAATGKQRWAARYFTGIGVDLPAAIAAGPHGSEVVVTGYAGVATPSGTQYATVAYQAATGTMIWARRYGRPPITTFNQATAVAFTPGHPEVIVTGLSADATATIAYRS